MKSKKGISLKNIHIGEVVLIKEYKDRESMPASQTVIGCSDNRIVAKSPIRKVVFVQGNEAKILNSKLTRKNEYTYKTINYDQELNVKNNILLVDQVRPVGDLLSAIGYPSVVTKKQSREITKMLLSSDKEISVLKHSLKLSCGDLFDIAQIEKANEQAIELNFFKTRKLPTEEQEIEKVYAKHFKK